MHFLIGNEQNKMLKSSNHRTFRLYGMFPCNFLSFMRQQDYESSSCSNIFNGKLEQFKLYLIKMYLISWSCFSDIVSPMLSTVRLHPLLVTHTREYEKTNARWKGLAEVHDVLAECSRYSLDEYEAGSREEWTRIMSLWADSSTPAYRSQVQLGLDSPPEAAVEATPYNTPYTTPVKDKARRPLDVQGSRHVKSINFKSAGPSSPTKTVASPTKESSRFKFPEVERRDSLFGEGAVLSPHPTISKRDSLGLGISSMRLKMTGSVDPETGSSRPSPVQFTSAPPELSSLTHTGDQAREETDAEVSSITGSVSGVERLSVELSTRHITPQMFSESANTSRTISRVSGEPETECGHDQCEPDQESVSQLVTRVMRRVRRITECDQSEMSAASQETRDDLERRRSLSFPNIFLEMNSSAKVKVAPSPKKSKLRFSSTQTDPSPNFLLYETLFPYAIPQSTNSSSGKPLPAPQQLLRTYIDNAKDCRSKNVKDLSCEIELLRSQVCQKVFICQVLILYRD